MSILRPVQGEEGTEIGTTLVLPSRELQTFPLQMEKWCDDGASPANEPWVLLRWEKAGRGVGH